MSGVSVAANRPPVPLTKIEDREERDPALVLADWQAARVRTALGVEFRQSSRVLLRRPGWMPRFIFHELLRAIVIETDGKIRVRATAAARHRAGSYLEAIER